MIPAAVAAFRKLHESGCFVLPNPWDVGSAIYLHHLGFQALATTSAGVAFTRGLPDGANGMDRDAMLAHFRELVTATPLPVNADFQNGYADEPEGVAANVSACVATGVAGLSIEDATGRDADPLYEHHAGRGARPGGAGRDRRGREPHRAHRALRGAPGQERR